MMRLVLVALLVALATAAAAAGGDVRAARDPAAGSYIVVFKADAVRTPGEAGAQRPTVAAAAQELAQAHGGSLTHVYQHALEGFSVKLTAAELSALPNPDGAHRPVAARSAMIARGAFDRSAKPAATCDGCDGAARVLSGTVAEGVGQTHRVIAPLSTRGRGADRGWVGLSWRMRSGRLSHSPALTQGIKPK